MKTIVVWNQKGGSGKSTAAVHLATAAEHAGDGPAIMSDADPQGSVSDWTNQRRKSGLTTPGYTSLTIDELDSKLAALDKAGAQYLFIDTAPSTSDVNVDLFARADLVLIPLNPTPTDLRALVKALPLVKQSGKPFFFILSRVRSNLRNNEAAATALTALGLVLETRFHERVVYSDSFGNGRTALEIEPNGTAAKEITAAWQDLKRRVAALPSLAPAKAKPSKRAEAAETAPKADEFYGIDNS